MTLRFFLVALLMGATLAQSREPSPQDATKAILAFEKYDVVGMEAAHR